MKQINYHAISAQYAYRAKRLEIRVNNLPIESKFWLIESRSEIQSGQFTGSGSADLRTCRVRRRLPSAAARPAVAPVAAGWSPHCEAPPLRPQRRRGRLPGGDPLQSGGANRKPGVHRPWDRPAGRPPRRLHGGQRRVGGEQQPWGATRWPSSQGRLHDDDRRGGGEPTGTLGRSAAGRRKP